MKRLIPLALIALALAAVPAAFADDGSTPPPPTQTTQRPGAGPAQRFLILRLRLDLAALRFARHCHGNASSVPQACLDFAKKVEQRLQTLDSNIQARIAKIQQTCSTSSSSTSTTTGTAPPTKDPCANADKRIARLQQIDARVKALAQRVQGWLDGTGGSSSSSTSDSTLGQAATGLNQLTQQAGANG
ncbi:MAG TPA: hypothetical protein VMS63_01070 [Gaiellaceae bacterium]|jgi:hypothetical protein|nr:hypothetical protein [Gaiellaceae bacterium]